MFFQDVTHSNDAIDVYQLPFDVTHVYHCPTAFAIGFVFAILPLIFKKKNFYYFTDKSTNSVITEPYRSLSGHSSRVTGLSWNRNDNNQLASSSYDGTVQVNHSNTFCLFALANRLFGFTSGHLHVRAKKFSLFVSLNSFAPA